MSNQLLRAIISDIHGQEAALAAVLADIKLQGADEIICLGDIVGYGPDPVQCLSLIRKVTKWSLCGNHDLAVFMTHAVGFNPAAAVAIANHRKQLKPGILSLPDKVAAWRWLENLPSKQVEDRVLYVHGSPRDPVMEYVLEEDFQGAGVKASQKCLEIFDSFEWLCFVGHSHRPGIATHEYKWMKPSDLKDQAYVLPKDEKTLVNVGAVGHAQLDGSASSYVLFDGERVRFRRVFDDA